MSVYRTIGPLAYKSVRNFGMRQSHVYDQCKLYSELSDISAIVSGKTLMMGQYGDFQGLNIHPQPFWTLLQKALAVLRIFNVITVNFSVLWYLLE